MRLYVTSALMWMGGFARALNVARQGEPIPVISLPGSVFSPPAPTATSSSTPSPTPSFSFSPIETMTACNSGTITWSYSGPQENITLAITNQGVPQTNTPAPNQASSSGSTPGQIVTLIKRPEELVRRQNGVPQVLATNVNTSALAWSWPIVAIPAGYYVVQASGGMTAQSGPFRVLNGSDTSCLLGTPSSTSAASPTTSSSSPSVAVGSSSTNVGAIVGGVIGGLIIISAAIAALWLFCRRRNGNGSTRVSRQWGGLKSTDSHDPGVMYANPQPRASAGSTSRFGLGQSESMGRIAASRGHGTPGATPGVSDEDISLAEEKLVTPSSPTGAFGAGAPPSFSASNHSHRRSSASSSFNYSKTRGAGAASSTTNINPTSSTEMTNMSRSGSGSTRRTPRKAVPKYDPAELGEPSPSGASHLEGSPSSNPFGDAIQIPELSHKSSFGYSEKPMHYLIPDLPPPGRD